MNFTQSATIIMDLKAKIPGIAKDAPDRHTTRTLPSEPQRRENNRFGGPIRTPRKYTQQMESPKAIGMVYVWKI